MKIRNSLPLRAFTLIEIVIAVTVFATIMIGIMACWKCIINGTQTGEAAAAAAQRARISMKSIEDALNNSEISQANIQYYSFVADTSQKFASLSMAARLPANFLGSGYYGDNVMRRVTFDVEKGENGSADLVMTQYPLLAKVNEQNPPKMITLAHDVTMFELDFWSPKDGDWMTEFLFTNEFPPMIRVTLGIGHSGRDGTIPYDLISRVIPMPILAH
jgi:hypothetical protein